MMKNSGYEGSFFYSLLKTFLRYKQYYEITILIYIDILFEIKDDHLCKSLFIIIYFIMINIMSELFSERNFVYLFIFPTSTFSDWFLPIGSQLSYLDYHHPKSCSKKEKKTSARLSLFKAGLQLFFLDLKICSILTNNMPD